MTEVIGVGVDGIFSLGDNKVSSLDEGAIGSTTMIIAIGADVLSGFRIVGRVVEIRVVVGGVETSIEVVSFGLKDLSRLIPELVAFVETMETIACSC